MSDVLGNFVQKKKDESEFLSLKDGESVVIKELVSIKPDVKAGFDGKPKDVLNFVVKVETSEGVREKLFQNGTARFATEMSEKLGATAIGSGFTLTRTGEQAKTRYVVTAVVPPKAPAA